MRKQMLYVTLIIVLLLAGGFLIYTAVNKTENLNSSLNTIVSKIPFVNKTLLPQSSSLSQITVVSWDPATAKLVYDVQGNQESIIIKVINPVIIVRINEASQPINEQIITGPGSALWTKAFCQGDNIELITDNQNHITNIRNLGPRACR